MRRFLALIASIATSDTAAGDAAATTTDRAVTFAAAASSAELPAGDPAGERRLCEMKPRTRRRPSTGVRAAPARAIMEF